jgi:ribulose-phosphate 3-epimerase
MAKIAPSILSANFANLEKDVMSVQNAGARYLHIDVMDGHFVPNISFGSVVLKALRDKSDMIFDVHLMIENPDQYIEEFADAGAEIITVHQEACPHLHRTIQKIKEAGKKVGVSINPATPITSIFEVLDDIDLVLIMSVNPGFGGQSLIESCVDKVARLAMLKAKHGYKFKIEIDGGVTLENVQMIKDAGAEVIVAGSAVFGAEDIEQRVKDFIEILES